ncbi:hypothetical protein SAMN05444920_1142 [Nonomuraea solani]|uniref:Uncharacterized protein n=1 Tax=Nonomuraea solani TaxID=1144553 RepID=A0A1H6ERU5_9ACTN|nr:hypothetical protein [Nonomuraea solani]SEG99726.1 hypothetical protein SAMN05444920_1142 [Nonomuraea solani]
MHWQITQLGRNTIQGKPKTEASDRVIALLRTHRRNQAAQRLAAGEARIDSGFVFTNELGEPLHPQHISDQFNRLAYETELPPADGPPFRAGCRW